MTMWPQITMLALFGVSLGVNIQKGQVGSGLFAMSIELGLLYAGGFFACFGVAP